MEFKSTRLPYRQTGVFSKIVLDYIDQSETVKPFYSLPPTISGIQKAIKNRDSFPIDRVSLVEALRKQYTTVPLFKSVADNIESLLDGNTFTITTAHQNNIFTGPLYFIYKIIHVIKIAQTLNSTIPGKHFVPVYYMGSEDADLDELNHIYVGEEKMEWKTKQTGAVGRMKVDNDLIKMVDDLEGQLGVEAFGKEIITLIRECYKKDALIQDATFQLVHSLFSEFGLVILIPDNRDLKRQAIAMFEDELINQKSSSIVEQSASEMQRCGYKVQAHPREINLFYLLDGSRERIIEKAGVFSTVDGKYSFSREQILEELRSYPERFSPNVILRGIFQEKILPNLAFVGGGGETAYWLQLRNLFQYFNTCFPILVLRNSFLIVEKKWQQRIAKLGFEIENFFLDEKELLSRLVLKNSSNETRLNGSLSEIEHLYDSFKKQASAVDATLEKHVDALKLKTVHRLQELEKKMLRAEKRKFSDHQRQIHAVKSALFPNAGLQERHDNMSPYYAKWGKSFLHTILENSPALEQEFVILSEL